MHQGLFQAQMLLGSEAFAGVRLCCHVVALLDVECLHVVHLPSLEAGDFLPRAECSRRKL